jgi:cell wall-associated NlpC family hydrolase
VSAASGPFTGAAVGPFRSLSGTPDTSIKPKPITVPPVPAAPVHGPAAQPKPSPYQSAPPPAPAPPPVAAVPTGESAVLAAAARYVGAAYRYGSASPRGFDCSGYTGYVYHLLGIFLPRTADQQMQATRRIPRSQARIGDLVFFVSAAQAYHVGIYAGHGQMYNASRPGRTVQKQAIWSADVVFGRVRR